PLPTLFPYTTLFRSLRRSQQAPRRRRRRVREAGGFPRHWVGSRFRTPRWHRIARAILRFKRRKAALRSSRTGAAEWRTPSGTARSEEHTSELQSLAY